MVRGYNPDGIDGVLGQNTQTALRRFQATERLPVTGYLDVPTLDALGITTSTPSLGSGPVGPAASPSSIPATIEAEPSAPASIAPVTLDPVWLDQPSAQDLDRLRPRGADRRLAGQAVIRCTVLDEGTLTSCFALSESPPGKRFGQAGVRAGALYRMQIDGPYAAFVGREVELTVTWPAR
jgi:peptidoglycan hydrolase-like protein with peptidoglycan-binding domain